MKKLLALLLAATMLLTLCACGEKEEKPSGDTAPTYGDPPPEDMAEVAETFIIAYRLQDKLTYFSLFCYDALQEWKDKELANGKKTEAEYCAEAQAQADEQGLVFDYPIDSFANYLAAKHEVEKQYTQSIYGAYTVSVEILGAIELSAEEVAERRGLVIGAHGDYADQEALNAVTEMHTVTMRFHIEGEKKTLSENYYVHLANYQGEWRVVGHST